MAIRIRDFDRLQCGEPDVEEATDGHVITFPVFAGARDPIHVHLHRMAPGSVINWAAGSGGHLAFVWQGAVSVGGCRLAAGSMILAEHGAGTTAIADGEATLLVFHGPSELPEREGGHVHLLAAKDVPQIERLGDRANVGAALFADSDCATCALWLHGNDFRDPGFVVAPHFHSEDEVIVVTGGQIVLGPKSYGRGTAISIPRDTVYGFRAGPRGLSFINFRPGRPSYGEADATATIDERTFYAMIPTPKYTEAQAMFA